MKTKTVWLVVGLLLVLSLTACSGSPIIIGGSPPVTRQMTASGSGQVFLTPDIVYVSIGVESRAENVSTALTRNNAQAKAIANALEAMGVEAKDIQTSAFNVYPQTTYNPLGEPGPVEYVVNNTVYVTVRDLQSMGKLLDTVVRAGANTIHSVTFDVQDKTEAFSKARRMAIDNARNNAQELADAADITLGEIITLNVYSYSPPVPFYEAKGMGGGGMVSSEVPFTSGQMVLTVNADLVYAIK